MFRPFTSSLSIRRCPGLYGLWLLSPSPQSIVITQGVPVFAYRLYPNRHYYATHHDMRHFLRTKYCRYACPEQHNKYKGFARGRLGAARYACGRRNRHSVERRKRSTNGATGDLKMPTGPYIVQRYRIETIMIMSLLLSSIRPVHDGHVGGLAWHILPPLRYLAPRSCTLINSSL